MIIIEAYIITKIKWYMDLKNISLYKLLMLYGLIGAFTYSIICIITTFIECPKGYKNLYDYFCPTEGDNNQKYYSNFFLYYKNVFSQIPLEEAIIAFSGILGFFLYKFNSLIIIKNLILYI